jgi:hypothetical protein
VSVAVRALVPIVVSVTTNELLGSRVATP